MGRTNRERAWLDLAGAVLADPFRPERGMVMARGPGLGMDWDEKAVRRYAPD